MQTKSSSRAKYKILLAALLLGAMASESALAQRHFRHGPRVGFYIGAPLLAYSFYRPYYYSPYYYPPAYYPPVVVAPTTYVEQPPVQQYQSIPINPPQQLQQQQFQPQQPDAAAQPSGNFWYYCADARAYYPYVKQCPAGWQQVTPQPQS